MHTAFIYVFSSFWFRSWLLSQKQSTAFKPSLGYQFATLLLSYHLCVNTFINVRKHNFIEIYNDFIMWECMECIIHNAIAVKILPHQVFAKCLCDIDNFVSTGMPYLPPIPQIWSSCFCTFSSTYNYSSVWEISEYFGLPCAEFRWSFGCSAIYTTYKYS